MIRANQDWRIPIAFAVLCLVWSSTWLVIRIGLVDLPPMWFVAIRFFIASLFLFLFSVGRTPIMPLSRKEFGVLCLSALLMFSMNYPLIFWAEQHISSGLAAVTQASIPIWGMFFANKMLTDEPLEAKRIIGAVVAMAGVALICWNFLAFNGVIAFWGGIAVAVSAICAALSSVLLKSRKLPISPSLLAAWQMFLGAIPIALLGFFIEGNPIRFHWTHHAVLCVLYLAAIGSSLTFLLLYWLLPRVPVTNLQTISLITPPGALLIGWAFGGEVFSMLSIAGSLLVLLGIRMIITRKPPAPN